MMPLPITLTRYMKRFFSFYPMGTLTRCSGSARCAVLILCLLVSPLAGKASEQDLKIDSFKDPVLSIQQVGGTVLIGAMSGLWQWNDFPSGQPQRVKQVTGFGPHQPRGSNHLSIQPVGNAVLIGARSGLWRWDNFPNGQIQQVKQIAGSINAIQQAGSTVLVGTNSGLWRWDGFPGGQPQWVKQITTDTAGLDEADGVGDGSGDGSGLYDPRAGFVSQIQQIGSTVLIWGRGGLWRWDNLPNGQPQRVKQVNGVIQAIQQVGSTVLVGTANAGPRTAIAISSAPTAGPRAPTAGPKAPSDLWQWDNFPNGQIQQVKQITGIVRTIQPIGSAVLVGTEAGLWRWDNFPDGQPQQIKQFGDELSIIQPTGSTVLVGTVWGLWRWGNFPNGQIQQVKQKIDSVNAIQPIGSVVLVGTESGLWRWGSFLSWQPQQVKQDTGFVRAIQQIGGTILVNSESGLWRWDVGDWNAQATITNQWLPQIRPGQKVEVDWQITGYDWHTTPEMVTQRILINDEKGKPVGQPVTVSSDNIDPAKPFTADFTAPGIGTYDVVIEATDLSGHTVSVHKKLGVVAFSTPQPLRWNSLSLPVQIAVSVLGVVALYFAVCFLLLWLRPIAFVGHTDQIQWDNLGKPLPGPTGSVLALVAGASLPYFGKHVRTRTAWIKQYRLNRSEFSKLPAKIREDFVKQTDCLDAWIDRRAEGVKKAFDDAPFVLERRFYIPLPLLIGDAANGKRIDAPKITDLRPYFQKERSVVAIIGAGGTGKSTLACQIARWAMADKPEERLTQQRMLPVFVMGEFDDPLKAITASVRQQLGQEETDEDLIKNLLRTQRLVVIIDALSERGPVTQTAVEAMLGGVTVNALLITTRRTPSFQFTAFTPFRPEPIEVKNLVFFLTEYLRRTNADELFPGADVLQLAQSLLGVVTNSKAKRVTPLLIKLFVESAIYLVQKKDSLDALPASVPETILNYLRIVNPQDPKTPNYIPDDKLIPAARLLGWCSLEEGYVPVDFFGDIGEAALSKNGLWDDNLDMIDRLVGNGVLKELPVAGSQMLRFELDPVAEYLAAMYFLHRFKDGSIPHIGYRPTVANGRSESDEVEDRMILWSAWLKGLQQNPRYPDGMRGFLSALEDCMTTYRTQFRIPDMPLPWKNDEGGGNE